MEFTVLFTKIVGPVMLLRALSIPLDRKHFFEMVEGLEKETKTIAFSFFPIALFMTGLAIVLTHTDRSSLAAYLILCLGYGAVAKSTALMLVPKIVSMKAQLLMKAGFLNVVLLMSTVVGGYFTWFGYFGH